MVDIETASCRVARLEAYARSYRSFQELLPEDLPCLGFKLLEVRFVREVPQEYIVSIRIRTVILGKKTPEITSVDLGFRIDLGNQFPLAPPSVTTLRGYPVPFHPEFIIQRLRASVYWHMPEWQPSIPIGDYIRRMVRTLAFDMLIVDVDGPNRLAGTWLRNALCESPGLFPIAQSNIEAWQENQSLRIAVNAPRDSEPTMAPKNQGRRFTIVEEGKRNEPTLAASINFRSLRPSSHRSGLQRTSTAVLSADAFAQIEGHIGWGQRTESNHVEQGGLLLGRVIKVDNHIWILAEVAIPARGADGSPGYLQLTHSDWKDMFEGVDSHSRDGAQYLVGWYHTHPNELEVFMSGTDKNTQRRLFNQEWHIAIVFNPHKRKWKAFCGPDALECEGFVAEGSEIDANPKDKVSGLQEVVYSRSRRTLIEVLAVRLSKFWRAR